MTNRNSNGGDTEMQALLDLARDKSVDGRTRLVEIVGDLFFDGRRVLSDIERGLMTEILRRLITMWKCRCARRWRSASPVSPARRRN